MIKIQPEKELVNQFRNLFESSTSLDFQRAVNILTYFKNFVKKVFVDEISMFMTL